MMNLSHLSLLLSLTTFSIPSTCAVPIATRTNCRCTAISTTDSTSAYLLSTTQNPNSCADLGPSLEYLRHSEPEVYQAYLSESRSRFSATPTEESRQPLSTSVLLGLAARNGFARNLDRVLPPSGSPTERPQGRIVCKPELEDAGSEFQDSKTTLFALHIIVIMAFLACIAECVSLSFDWLAKPREEKQVLQLTGAEKELKAFPSPDVLFSPGAEKKMFAYAIQPPTLSTGKKCTCVAYQSSIDEDDDDEMNRPVL